MSLVQNDETLVGRVAQPVFLLYRKTNEPSTHNTDKNGSRLRKAQVSRRVEPGSMGRSVATNMQPQLRRAGQRLSCLQLSSIIRLVARGITPGRGHNGPSLMPTPRRGAASSNAMETVRFRGELKSELWIRNRQCPRANSLSQDHCHGCRCTPTGGFGQSHRVYRKALGGPCMPLCRLYKH